MAAVANLNLSVANVALPSIGLAFDASQTELNLVAVGYSLGLAASVLWLGALGDRYGRKLMLLLGVGLSIPACLLAAFAPSIDVLIGARLLGGLSAGMAYPTTLALITALWSGPARTRSDRAVVGLGGAIASLGPLIAGWLLQYFAWGSVFLITLPLAVVALLMALRFVPRHVNESTEPVDNLGGLLSALLVGAVILAINFAPVPNEGALVAGLVVLALAAGMAFVLRQRRAANPLYDLHVAGRRIFWVAACAGIIVFGSLMGAMFIGQQFLQNVLAVTPPSRRGWRSSRRPCAWCWSRPARPGWWRRAGRATRCSSAMCSACLASSPCCCCGRRAARTGRSALAMPSSASASVSPARRPRTPSPAPSRWSGRAWRRGRRTCNATSAGR